MVNVLQQKRLAYEPPLPPLLRELETLSLSPHGSPPTLTEPLRALFPHIQALTPYRIEEKKGAPGHKLIAGVLFSGGQAAGGHNVIAGLFDGLKEIHPDSVLIGFLDGPSGLIHNLATVLDHASIHRIRNQGGFDLIGSSRTKIETPEQFQAVARAMQERQIQTLFIIGGDDSNTNAALLAEYFLQHGVQTGVIGVPKTIDGDLRSADIEISFGFDSACKTYSELIGNIARDALSAKKYYHFIKLMGRSASNITLECALQTAPNLALIGEEQATLSQIVTEIAALIVQRKKVGKEFGIVLLPEGLLEFIPECKMLIQELNRQLALHQQAEKVLEHLSPPHRSLFFSLPEKIRSQLLLDRDPHGNVQLSQIETELLISGLVKEELRKQNISFNVVNHFFGYEGRACFPSNFDANYCYALGRLGSLAAREGVTGGILAIKHLSRPVSEWEPAVIPLVQLMKLETRKGVEKPVIAKALVDLTGKPFSHFARIRKKWRLEDLYQMPGPIQFFGDPTLTDRPPISLCL